MNMKMMMHSEYDPEHYKKNIHINFKQGQAGPFNTSNVWFSHVVCEKLS